MNNSPKCSPFHYQYSTTPTSNRIDYPLIVNDSLVFSPLVFSPLVFLVFSQNPRFQYLATHKSNSKFQIFNERCRKEFHRLDSTNLEVIFEITAKFHNFSPHPLPFNTTVIFKSLPHTFIATNINLFVSDHPPFRLLHSSIAFLNTTTFLKYTAKF